MQRGKDGPLDDLTCSKDMDMQTSGHKNLASKQSYQNRNTHLGL